LIFVADWGGIVNETAEKCKNSTQNVGIVCRLAYIVCHFAVAAYRNVSEIGQVSEDIYTQSLKTSNAPERQGWQ